MSRKTHHALYAKLDALYQQLPTIACKGLCSEACGPIVMSMAEAERLKKADQWRRQPAIRADLTCVYLTERQRCSVYPVRPLICRAWGLVKRMSCMHGCVPSRWLSDLEFVEIAKAIERIGGAIVVSGLDALEDRGESFLPLRTELPPEQIEELAERTRGLRALHGGRIVGVVPTPAGEQPTWIDIDAVRRTRREEE